MNSNSQKIIRRRKNKPIPPQKLRAFKYESLEPELEAFYEMIADGPRLDYQQIQILKNQHFEKIEILKAAFNKPSNPDTESFASDDFET